MRVLFLSDQNASYVYTPGVFAYIGFRHGHLFFLHRGKSARLFPNPRSWPCACALIDQNASSVNTPTGTAVAAMQVKAFFEANPVPNSARKLSQMLESMAINVRFFKTIAASPLSTEAFWEGLEV